MKYLHVIERSGSGGKLRFRGKKRVWDFRLNRARLRHELVHEDAEAMAMAERDIRHAPQVWPILALVEPLDQPPPPEARNAGAVDNTDNEPVNDGSSTSPATETEPDVESMTRPELLRLAEARGLEVNPRTKRSELIDMLR